MKLLGAFVLEDKEFLQLNKIIFKMKQELGRQWVAGTWFIMFQFIETELSIST